MSSRRLLSAVVLALTFASVGVAVAERSTSPAVVSEPAERLDDHHRTLLISDSAWLGIKTYGAVDTVRGFAHELDLASCRRRVAPSCRNYDGHVPITMAEEIAWRGDVFDTLVVATGYNDGAASLRSDLESIVALTRRLGYERIVWLTLRADVSYRSPGGLGFADVFAEHNATVASLASDDRYPELVVADWASYARDRPEWFANDGIHLRGHGPWAAGDYISRKLAFLDARPCPWPEPVGDAADDRCPDPDVTGPTVDIAATYPVGDRCAGEPFAMEWSGRSSWPEPACWAG